MDWATLNPLLLAVFSEIACAPIPDVPPFQAQWKGRSQEMESPDYQHTLTLQVLRVAGIGADELRYSYDPEVVDTVSGLMGTQTATVCGLRQITMQLRAEVSENTDDHWCMSILDRISTRLGLDRYIERLRDEGNCAFTDWEDAIDHSATYDGRYLSIATMDLTLYGAINDVDEVPNGWIERVVVSSQINAKTDVTDVVIPPIP